MKTIKLTKCKQLTDWKQSIWTEWKQSKLTDWKQSKLTQTF